MPTKATEKRCAERETEQARVAEFVAARSAYETQCEARGLRPLDGLEWQAIMAVSALGPDFIPYKTALETIWVRNLKHKTGRQDLPFAFLNAQALRE